MTRRSVTRYQLATVLAALGAFIVGRSLAAQGLVEITLQPSCRSCRIELENLVILGRASDPAGINTDSRITLDDRGRYYVAPTDLRGRIAVYDSKGQFLQTVGQFGSGPGEYRYPVQIIARGDTLHIFDQARHTVLSPTYEFLTSSPLPGHPYDVTFTSDGSLVLNMIVPTRDRVGYPLHLLNVHDSLLLSFGSSTPSLRPDEPLLVRLSSSQAGHVWLAHFNQYRVEQWDRLGRLQRVLQRQVDWFEAWPWNQFRPEQPRVLAIHEDKQGLLWVVIRVADPEWKPVLEARHGELKPPSAAEMQEHLSSIVELIDPERGELVASERFDRVIAGFITDGTVYGLRQESNGLFVIDVWRIHLRETEDL